MLYEVITGRDTFSTRYLLPKGMELGESLNSIERQQGLDDRGLEVGRKLRITSYNVCYTKLLRAVINASVLS